MAVLYLNTSDTRGHINFNKKKDSKSLCHRILFVIFPITLLQSFLRFLFCFVTTFFLGFFLTTLFSVGFLRLSLALSLHALVLSEPVQTSYTDVTRTSRKIMSQNAKNKFIHLEARNCQFLRIISHVTFALIRPDSILFSRRDNVLLLVSERLGL